MMAANRSEAGISIVECMVSLTLLAIAISGSVNVFTTSWNGNAMSRTHGSVLADIQEIIDDYREQDFSTILAPFGENIAEIQNGSTSVSTVTSTASRAQYTVTLTAIKTRSTGVPEGVKVSISALHRRGKMGDGTYRFETIIANVIR